MKQGISAFIRGLLFFSLVKKVSHPSIVTISLVLGSAILTTPWKPPEPESALMTVFMATRNNFHGLAGHLQLLPFSMSVIEKGKPTRKSDKADWHTHRAGAALTISALLHRPRRQDTGTEMSPEAELPGGLGGENSKKRHLKCLKNYSIYMNSIFPLFKCTPASLKMFLGNICPIRKRSSKTQLLLFLLCIP